MEHTLGRASPDDQIQQADAFPDGISGFWESGSLAPLSSIGAGKAEIESLIELYFLRRAQQRVFDEFVQARKARDKRRARPKENPETLQLLEAKVAALQELETSIPKGCPVRLRHLVGHGSEPNHDVLYPCDEAKEAVRPPNAQEWSDFGQDVASIARKMAALAHEVPDLFSLDFQPPSISMFKVPLTLPPSDDMMQVDDGSPVSEKDSSSITTLWHDITHVHSTFSYINEVRVDEERPALEDLIDQFDVGLKEEENKWPNEGIDLENLRQQYPKWKEEAEGRLKQLREMVHELEEQNKQHRGSNFALRLGVYKFKNDVDEIKELYNAFLDPPTETARALAHPQFTELMAPIKNDVSIAARKHVQTMLNAFHKDLKSAVTEISSLMYHDLQNTLEPIVESTEQLLRDIYTEP
ncbi:uncharacterized protein EI90DRAFT_3131964 [Cantharellus anzutake]|uniref:uncharacterized protein n=1 Tax=Cantharellus anzutake TaxID=1750568 RepID=UPI001906CAB8|nr:uncharacterized protein EI90DRAFT_3131964 [Cantharellus anzutake]KAF8320603.1 hypothetical protein EI90DRAFT_3131964 [Cantharellus anzutake]